jgi:anthranilate phosphoribosyltransferase
VLLNAAGAVAAGGHAQDLAEGYELAARAVDSGAAAERLEALVAFSRARPARPDEVVAARLAPRGEAGA